jgi:multicomponent Na+:H+ antiporter subunit G
LGAIIAKGFSAIDIKVFLCVIFLLLTSPVSAHALARAAHKSQVKLWEKSVCDKYAEDKDR